MGAVAALSGCGGAGQGLADQRIGVGGAEPEQQHVPGLDVLTAEPSVPDGPASGEDLGGRVLPEDLVHGIADAAPATGHGVGELVLGEHQPHGVADPVGGGEVPGGRDGHQIQHVLLVGERLGEGEHAGGHVVPGCGPLRGHQPGHVFPEPQMGALRVRSAVGEVLQHPRDVGPFVVGEADQPGEDEDGEWLAEVGDEVGRAAAAHLVDEPVRQLLAVPADRMRIGAFEGRSDHADVPPVLLARAEVDRRQGAPHHGQQRPVLGYVRPLVPQADIAREQLPVAGDLMELAVADDQPGGEPAREFHRDDGPVIAAHGPVDGLGVGLEFGPVERHGPGVSRTAGRRRRRRRRGLGGRWARHES